MALSLSLSNTRTGGAAGSRRAQRLAGPGAEPRLLLSLSLSLSTPLDRDHDATAVATGISTALQRERMVWSLSL